MPVFEEENREWAPVDIADAYRDGRILYWSAYQAIMEKLQQEGSGVPPKSRVADARSLIGLVPGDSRMEREPGPAPGFITEPERMIRWMKDPDGRVIKQSLSEEEVTELVSQGWSRETDPHPSRYPDLFSDALVWVQNPAADWSEDGQFRQEVSEEEAARLVAQGWSREAGPTSYFFVY